MGIGVDVDVDVGVSIDFCCADNAFQNHCLSLQSSDNLGKVCKKYNVDAVEVAHLQHFVPHGSVWLVLITSKFCRAGDGDARH